MKKLIFGILLLVGFQATMQAQDLDEYRYIKVPEKFEFLSEENQYQLNELTAFLFEKYGFNVLYREDTPAGTDPCEILRADVENQSGFLQSKVKVHLRDCHDQVVFSSREGKSREKDRKASFHEALRDAFQSVEQVKYNYSPAEVIVQTVIPPEERKEISEAAEERNQEQGDLAAESPRFLRDTIEYRIKKTAPGYELIRGGEQVAILVKSSGGDHFLFTSELLQGSAYFDLEGNLVVEYIDPASNELRSVQYMKMD